MVKKTMPEPPSDYRTGDHAQQDLLRFSNRSPFATHDRLEDFIGKQESDGKTNAVPTNACRAYFKYFWLEVPIEHVLHLSLD